MNMELCTVSLLLLNPRFVALHGSKQLPYKHEIFFMILINRCCDVGRLEFESLVFTCAITIPNMHVDGC